MVKRIKTDLYRFGHNSVEICPNFLYEVTVYEVSNNMFRLLESTYFISDKMLCLKPPILKKYRNKLFVKDIILLGVPSNFIKEHNLNRIV